MSDHRSGVRSSPRGRGATVAATLLLVCAAPAAGQDWHQNTIMRQTVDTETLEVELGYGAGELTIEPADDLLYWARVRYDANRFDAVNRYENGRLQLGVEGRGRSLSGEYEGNRLEVRLGRGVPLMLDLEFGAVEADIELGGLSVADLEVSTGASETRLRFSRPNPVRMREAHFTVGAADFQATGLGHANVERVRLEGGVADMTLGFEGRWTHDVHLDVDLGLGSVTVRMPRDIGVRVDKETFLASVGGERMNERGDSHYSNNWDSARYKLTIDVDAAFGDIEIDWID